MKGKIIAVCTSDKKGEKKVNVGKGELVVNFGLAGDVHGGDWHRQVSLLAMESIDKMRGHGLEVNPGDFAENITTEGLVLHTLPIGTRMKIGDILLEVTQIGKECHSKCNIYHTVGDCVMPREGIFVKVLKGGPVAAGDTIEVIAGD
ncbi:MAG TPA: MOSC domain-containing protein [Firmicutes bacterium]|nr:MOSC domain-containing protein [Bacillota bacterium]